MRRIYILGAGASRGAGLPLTSDFIKRGNELKDKFEINDRLWKFINEPKFRNFTIEDILGYIDMEMRLLSIDIGIDPDEKNRIDLTNPYENHIYYLKGIKSGLLNYIQAVIILCYRYYDEEKISNYSKLLDRFIKCLTGDDIIITFNYDILIDYFLKENGFIPQYGMEFQHKNEEVNQKKTHIPLFKLHGSLNWTICPQCQKPSWNEYDKFLERSNSNSIDLNKMKFSNKFETRNHRICYRNEKHEIKIFEETLIIPPTWNKHDYRYIRELWLKASENIKTANRIIFIGYSFPQSDIYFKYLLLSSLPKDNYSVEVIDPNVQDIAGCYLEIFRNNISFKSMTFEEYIADTIF